MAYPDKYTRQFGFQQYQDSHPNTPAPGDEHDSEFDAIARQLGVTIDFLKKSIRSDGKLANRSVGVDQLAADLALGFHEPTTYAVGASYSVNDTVFYLDGFYQCKTAHVATDTFNTDYWTLLVDFTAQMSAAAASAAAAALSEANAAASESAAATSETNAASSASAAATSETNAAASESAAATSETNAASSASAAATSETNAASSAAAAEAAVSAVEPVVVISFTAAPPTSPAAGDCYGISESATGAWAGKDNDLARWSGAAWDFFAADDGRVVFDQSAGYQKSFTTASGWEAKSGTFVTFKTGSQIRTVGERLGNYPDVRDYGYKTANTRAQNKTALDAYIGANQYLALPPETITYTGTLSLGNSQHLIGFGEPTLDNTDANAIGISVDGDNVHVEGLRLISTGAGQITLGASAASGSPIKNATIRKIKFDPTVGAAYGLHIHRIAGLTAENLHCIATGYGILQENGKACSDLNFRGVIGEDMYADLFEFEGASAAAYCDGLTINDVDYRGAHDWTTAATEKRVMGFTSVKNVIIDNVRYRNAAGDAAFHFENVGGDFIISNTNGQDCGGNNGVFYILNSFKSLQISNTNYRKTVSGGANAVFSTASGAYQNEMLISGGKFANTYSDPLQWLDAFDFSSHSGFVIASNIMAENTRIFANLTSANNKEFVGCRAYNNTYGFYADPGSSLTGGTDIKITGGVYSCSEYNILTSQNSGGTGKPTRWSINGTRFEYAGTGSGHGASLSNGVDCYEVGTSYSTGLTTVPACASHKSVWHDGSGWVADA